MQQIHFTPPPAVMQQLMPLPVQVSSPSMISRVCTLAPSPPRSQSGPGRSIAQCEERKAVTIPLTVEELRVMITEAVQNALSSAEVSNSIEEADVANGGICERSE
jgi:hypothetical protein